MVPRLKRIASSDSKQQVARVALVSNTTCRFTFLVTCDSQPCFVSTLESLTWLLLFLIAEAA